MKDPKKVKAGLTLAASVSRDYYRFIGRRGGRASMFNHLMRVAQSYDCRKSRVWRDDARSWPSERINRFNQGIRQHYREMAEGYRDYNGNRMMLELFDRQHDIKKKRKRCQ
jgi:hypothetical protein